MSSNYIRHSYIKYSEVPYIHRFGVSQSAQPYEPQDNNNRERTIIRNNNENLSNFKRSVNYVMHSRN